MDTLQQTITIAAGRITAPRCQAKAKHSQQQCRKAAMRGKRVCRAHGGKSTGPRSEQGRERCAAAKTIHGWETRQKRQIRAEKFREMKALFNSLNW
ncbi:MAG: HGGxSTG domain-containing protein [Planktomarina sp.]|nr:HGGxSTG domain-containing protein [Planktomarina sp.]